MTDTTFPPSDARVADLQKLGEGRQAEVFAWQDGSVVKLFRGPQLLESARHEITSMQAAEASGVPMARALGSVSVEGRPGILMERLDGPDQLTRLGSRPWKIWPAAKTLARLHAKLHSAPVGSGLPSLKDAVGRGIATSELVPERAREAALADLQKLPDHDFVCHGDFHPGNIIETAHGPRVIDWSNVSQGDPLADVARTLLLARAGALPPGTPFLVRKLVGLGRRILLWRYLREYRKLRPFDPRDLDAWEVVNATERLTHGIPEEREYLLAFLEARLAPPTPQ